MTDLKRPPVFPIIAWKSMSQEEKKVFVATYKQIMSTLCDICGHPMGDHFSDGRCSKCVKCPGLKVKQPTLDDSVETPWEIDWGNEELNFS